MIEKFLVFGLSLLMAFSVSAATSQSTSKIKILSPIKERTWKAFLDSYNYVKPEGKLKGLQAENAFGFNFLGKNKDNFIIQYVVNQEYVENKVSSNSFQFRYNRNWTLNKDWTMTTMSRVYLPLKKYDQEIGKYGFRQYFRLGRDLTTKLSFRWETHARAYLYSEDSLGQQALLLRHLARLSTKLTSSLLAQVYVGYQTAHSNSGSTYSSSTPESEWETPSKLSETSIFILTLPILATKAITLVPAIEQFHKLGSEKGFSLLNPSETQYSMNLTVEI